MSSSYFNRVVAGKFYKARLTPRKEALSAINEYLRTIDGDDLLQTLDTLVARVKDCGPSSKFVDGALVRKAIAGMTRENDTTKPDSSASSSSISGGGDKGFEEQSIFVIDAIHTPKFKYNDVRKSYDVIPTSTSLHGHAKDKREAFVHRFHTVYQRLLRQKQFRPPENRFEKHRNYIQLTLTRSLHGESNEQRVVFGLLSCIQEGKYVLEDLDSYVKLDLSETKIDTGLFTENCFVLVEGRLEDEVFIVSSMSFPPAETRKQSLLMYPSMSSFGINLKNTDRVRLEASVKNGEMDDHTVVVLSDLWLDKPYILDNFRTLLEGFVDSVPRLFVLMGNFTSRPLGLKGGDVKKLQAYFDDLADIILEFPDLIKSSKFVFIPGPNDLGIGNVLPRSGLPRVITRKLRSNRFPRNSTIFPSNPCRILYGTRELLFFRQDITHQMRRNCILQPSTHETKDITNHLVKTILEQSHLCPLPNTTRPVHWENEHALHVYPLPDLLVLGDSVDQFNWSHYECSCANPASFALDRSFIIYHPGKNKVQFSRVGREVESKKNLELK